MGRMVESKLKTDLEIALDSNIIKWKIIDYKCSNFWIFNEHPPITPNRLIFVPVWKNTAGLMACFEAAYKWGYEGILFDKWDDFSIIQNVGKHSLPYPHVFMIPSQQ